MPGRRRRARCSGLTDNLFLRFPSERCARCHASLLCVICQDSFYEFTVNRAASKSQGLLARRRRPVLDCCQNFWRTTVDLLSQYLQFPHSGGSYSFPSLVKCRKQQVRGIDMWLSRGIHVQFCRQSELSHGRCRKHCCPKPMFSNERIHYFAR